jgi:hypothetical protein
MKKLEKIEANIRKDKKLLKRIESIDYYSVNLFVADSIRYMRAIREGRMINTIQSVSKSGMSRTIKFIECSRDKNRYSYMQFWSFFSALGYSEVKRTGYFRITGCGMDMIFHTNYNNIHRLHRLGFISQKECNYLAQQTPITI